MKFKIVTLHDGAFSAFPDPKAEGIDRLRVALDDGQSVDIDW